MAAESNYRSFVERVMPTVLKGYWGRRLVGAIAMLVDELALGITQAVHAPWLGDPGIGPAEDALRPAGSELSLPRYPNETRAQYDARLQRAWLDWPFAGDEDPLLAQLAAAGFPGAKIFDPRQWPNKPPSPYYSQFWIFFPKGTHTVTSAGPLIGSFVVGDGTSLGPIGITVQQLFTMRSIIRKWKPGHWVCRGIVFEVSGWTIGDGSVIGDPNLYVGGSHITVGPGV